MGGTLPEEGEMVVIQENQTILLDVSTPILGMLLIQGKGGKRCTLSRSKCVTPNSFTSFTVKIIMIFYKVSPALYASA